MHIEILYICTSRLYLESVRGRPHRFMNLYYIETFSFELALIDDSKAIIFI